MFRFAVFASAVLCASVVLAEKKPSSHDLVTSNPGTKVPDAGNSARLPVKRVVLYKNGIGYFEHTARVHGNQDLGIDFTTGQLNDMSSRYLRR